MTVTAMPGSTAADPEPEKKSPLKKVLVLAVVVLVAGAAVWFTMLKPSAEPTEPVAGEVVALDPIQINLAGGHYLRAGIALQLVEGAHEVDGSKALDALIEVYSGTDMSELVGAEPREAKREALVSELQHRYHDEVIGVYFTEFVTQ